MIHRRILDIGAGLEPHDEATDAVDRWDGKNIFKLLKDVGCHSPPRNLCYRYSVDMNEQLPYLDATFVKVISRYSLCTFGKQKAFEEAYRVLKSDGLIMIQTGRNLKGVKKLILQLNMVGFDEIVYHGDNSTFYIITARKPNYLVTTSSANS